MNSPQNDLAIEALSSTLATPKSATQGKKKRRKYPTCILFFSTASQQCAVSWLTQFHSPLAIKKHVFGLEVTVDDSLLVAAIHCLTDFIQHLEDELCVAK